MPLNRLQFLILVDLLFVNSKLKGSRKLRSLSSYTRLLDLNQTNTKDCHVCLLGKVGVEDMSLVASNIDTLVYLIRGSNTFIDLFPLQ